MWYICKIEYYSTMKKNEMLIFATRWVDTGYMLTKRSWTEDIHVHIYVYIMILVT
jgi:hypothetical protein